MAPVKAKGQVRVGNAGGYWGDDPHALERQLAGGPLDYVTQDFLAEITMSILQKQRFRNPQLGYATDLLEQLRPSLGLLQSRGARLITNAGGINPRGCAEQVEELARREGVPLQIAVVEGDDLMDQLDTLLEEGIDLRNMETGEDFSLIRSRVTSANAYLGVAPVLKALQAGAQIIITGRVTDTALTAACPVFEFDWPLEDWNRLASAVVAGHILECGAQASGGNLTDWPEVPSLLHIGYPIAEFYSDGSFTVTRHPDLGGVVNRKTVVSQLIYEMGDPRRYITPDVIADFSTIHLEETGPDRVRVSGVQGSPRTDQLKVSISYNDGFKAHGLLLVSRPKVVDKCRKIAETFWKSLEGLHFAETSTELVGYNACHQHLAPDSDPPEILLRLGVRDTDRGKIEEFARCFTALILSSVSGVAIVGARPRVQDVVAYWPALIPAARVSPRVYCLQSRRLFAIPWKDWSEPRLASDPVEPLPPPPSSSSSPKKVQVRLVELCYGRSGDKGDTCNIGIVARSPQVFDWLRRYLTEAVVKEYFGELCQGPVERFEVPNLQALNFLLHNALGGGGTLSLRIDPQGKTLAEALLLMPVEVPEDVLRSVPGPSEE